MTTTLPFGRSGLRRALLLVAVSPLGLLLGAATAQAVCTGNSGNKADIDKAFNNSVNENAPVTIGLHNSARGLVFTWSRVSGPAVTLNPSTGTSTSFVAPEIVTGRTGVLVIQLTASGCVGAADSQTVSINIANLNNAAPVAVASSSAPSVAPGTQVLLSGTSSYDLDNDPFTYSWAQTSGSPALTIVGGNTASASFVAPPVATTTTFRLTLTVTATFAPFLTSSAFVDVSVVAANQPPVAQISCPSTINEGQLITLNGSASSDPENGPLQYAFDQRSGFPVASIPALPHGSSVSFTAPSLGYLQSGLVSFGLTVTDSGNASDSTSDIECSFFIKDVTAPVLSGAADLVEEATSPSGAVASYSISAVDNVDGASDGICVPVSGSTFPLGETTVNCSKSDSAVPTNTGYASFKVTVVDTTAPLIDSHDSVYEEATSAAGAIVAYSSPATSDAYDGPGTATCAPASGTLFALTTTTVTCDATDTEGNAATSTSFDVTVGDMTAPSITPPDDVTVEATGFLTVVAYGTATGDDAVGPVTISSDAPPSFPVGTTTITWLATDFYSNSSEATSQVTVNDSTPPVVDDNPDQTLEATSALGAVATFANPAANDLVDGALASTCDYGSGAIFPLGTTTVTCSATDDAGNTGSSSFDITVEDTTPPVISAHGDETAEATGPSGAVVNYSNPTASDIVDGSVAVNCAPASGSTFAIATTTVNCSATDAANNTSYSSFNVLVEDTTPPVIAAHGNETAEATGPSGAVVVYTNPTASDIVDGSVAVNCAPASGSTFAIATTTVNCSATDAAGNIGYGSFDVKVEDTTPPDIAPHAPVIAEATGPSGAVVVYTNPTASDIVDGSVAVNCAPASGSTFAIATTTVNCSATDAAGNTGFGSFEVTVEDTTPPVISAHGNETAEATGPSGAVVVYTNPTASDIVDGSVAVNCAPASGSTFALGTTTVNCSATDAAGNTGYGSFEVTVEDTTAPVIATHANVTAEATGPSGAAVNYGNPTASDIVDGNVTVNCAPASGSTFALGTTTVNCSATDAAGNTSNSSFTVTVRDTTAPVIAFHADVNALATSSAGAIVTFTLPTASDLVDGSVGVTCSRTSGSTFAVGTTAVNCSATDAAGNIGTSTFNVIVSYNFTGFFRPIDNLPTVNVVKAGQAIPVKFSLGGNMGLAIMAPGYPKSVAMVCSGSLLDVVEETVTAGGSSLSYDPTTGQYNYVWKSEKSWAATCRQLQVKLADGSYHYANFSFTR